MGNVHREEVQISEEQVFSQRNNAIDAEEFQEDFSNKDLFLESTRQEEEIMSPAKLEEYLKMNHNFQREAISEDYSKYDESALQVSITDQ
mmetsp:Transcript_32639/g.24107  ORF Transcript_32639/g.24107 Transcript_32639/m.24107 type:complete len:90 (+) Transcript_32639:430-699(+)